MSLVSVFRLPMGEIVNCPIVRDQFKDESAEDFAHACTRRVLMDQVFNHLKPVLGIEAAQAAVNQLDKDRTLAVEAAKIGVQVLGILPAESLPDRDEFRAAWRYDGVAVVVDLPAAKQLAHDKRRRMRDEEMKPLDIEVTIPAKAAEAESKRQAVRDKYASMQSAVDAANSIHELRGALK